MLQKNRGGDKKVYYDKTIFSTFYFTMTNSIVKLCTFNDKIKPN